MQSGRYRSRDQQSYSPPTKLGAWVELTRLICIMYSSCTPPCTSAYGNRWRGWSFQFTDLTIVGLLIQVVVPGGRGGGGGYFLKRPPVFEIAAHFVCVVGRLVRARKQGSSAYVQLDCLKG